MHTVLAAWGALAAPATEPVTELALELPVLDLNENFLDGPYAPSADQSLILVTDAYDGIYFGIDRLGDALVDPETHPFWSAALEQVLVAPIVHYGRELPVPLAVWGHEEYHRASLRVGGLPSKNGNWLFSRWNGTVYGVTDAELTALKARDPQTLVRSYTAGIEFQQHLTQQVTRDEFFRRRPMSRALLHLDNAWYTWGYWSSAASPNSDLQKQAILDHPEHTGEIEVDRDFAGNDLTAWAYDLFSPDAPWDDRGPHPNGVGLARPIGWSDLSDEQHEYLALNRDLSLLNFVNPAAFFVPRIPVGEVALLPYLQHYGTSFGHAIDANLLVERRDLQVAVTWRTMRNHERTFNGLDLALVDLPLPVAGQELRIGPRVAGWVQPEDQRFTSDRAVPGGLVGLDLAVPIGALDLTLRADAKTEGWVVGNPYLQPTVSGLVGLRWVGTADGA